MKLLKLVCAQYWTGIPVYALIVAMPPSNPCDRQMSVILRPLMKESRGMFRIVPDWVWLLMAMMWMESQPPPTSGWPVGASLPSTATKMSPLCSLGVQARELLWTPVWASASPPTARMAATRAAITG